MSESRIRIAVRVHPRGSRVRRVWDGRRLEVWVREPPIGGAANEAVVQAVADWLGVPRSRVSIQTGFSSRSKIVEVTGTATLPPSETLP